MKVYSYNEIKESKLIYDRKPPAFGVIMTLLTLVLLTGALLWAGLSVKTYVVKASGIVTHAGKVNLMNTVSGEVQTLAAQEGQAVNAGDVILTIDSYQVRLQIAQLRTLVELYDAKIAAVNKLIAFVNNYDLSDESTHVNPFDRNDSETAKLRGDADTFIMYVKQQQTAESEEEFTQEQLDSVKSSFLSQQSVYASLDEYTAQRVQQGGQLQMYTDSLDAYTVRAGRDGIVHLNAGLTVGTVLQAGTLIGSISGNDASGLQFDTVVSATDRSKLTVGSLVEIALGGVLQAEYGVLTGKVTAIDNDSTQTEDGTVYYRVTVKPDKTSLTDRKGNTIDLTVGMLAEVRIKYDETTWLKWIVEQIGIKLI